MSGASPHGRSRASTSSITSAPWTGILTERQPESHRAMSWGSDSTSQGFGGSVVLVAVFAVGFLGERPAAREWLGLGLVATGVLLRSLRR